jgi:hypothetical protein
MTLRLKWTLIDSYETAKGIHLCLYAFRVGDDILYVGKAKTFGTRYSPGYRYLVTALLSAGHKLYVAQLSDEQWIDVIRIEQTLIQKWDPLTDQRCLNIELFDVDTSLPWK